VTVQEAFLPLKVVMVTFAVPFLSALKMPDLVYCNISVLLVFQLFLYEAVPSGRVASKLKLSPTPRVSLVLFRYTFLGAGRTVTLHVAFLPLKVVTVTLAVPFLVL